MALEVQLSAPEAWSLDSPEAMFAALTELVARGHRGTVQVYTPVESPGTVVWKLEATADSVREVEPAVGFLGDYFLLTGGVLRRLSAEEFAAVTA